jgi:hypothetical protein
VLAVVAATPVISTKMYFVLAFLVCVAVVASAVIAIFRARR